MIQSYHNRAEDMGQLKLYLPVDDILQIVMPAIKQPAGLASTHSVVLPTAFMAVIFV